MFYIYIEAPSEQDQNTNNLLCLWPDCLSCPKVLTRVFFLYKYIFKTIQFEFHAPPLGRKLIASPIHITITSCFVHDHKAYWNWGDFFSSIKEMLKSENSRESCFLSTNKSLSGKIKDKKIWMLPAKRKGGGGKKPYLFG